MTGRKLESLLLSLGLGVASQHKPAARLTGSQAGSRRASVKQERRAGVKQERGDGMKQERGAGVKQERRAGGKQEN